MSSFSPSTPAPCLKRLRDACLAFTLAAVWFSQDLRGQVTLVLQPGSMASTLAGSGADQQTKAGDARLAALGSPGAIAYDPAGNLYVADPRYHRISRVNTVGQLAVIAGTGRQGFTGDGGAATSAEWNAPGGIAVDASGNVFIADTGNQRVRRIAADGTVATVAGTGQPGFSGDGGPAQAARFRSPAALAVDTAGSLYIADSGNHRIRKLRTDGTVVTVAGNGSQGQDGDGGPAIAAALDAPSGLTVLPDGRLLISDRVAHRLRVLQPDGTIVSYPAGAAMLRRPNGVAADSNGSVYVADAAAHTVTQMGADGSTALAGSGEQGPFAEGAPLATALDTPSAVAVRSNGDVAFSDKHNHQVQRVSLPLLNFGSVPAGSSSLAQVITLQNGGTGTLTVLALEIPGGFSLSTDPSTCSAVPFTMQPAQQCKIGLAFAPLIQGIGDATARVRVLGGAPQALLLTGMGTASGSLSSSITALRSDGSIAYAGSPVTLTATVANSLLALPIGNVTFLDDVSPLASSALAAGGAKLTTSALLIGTHTLRAMYSGDSAYSSSTSPAITVTVVPTPDFTLLTTAASYSGKSGGTVTIPMTLLPINGTLNRPVQFAVSGLPTGAKATFSPATLTLGGDTAVVTLTLQMPVALTTNHLPLNPLEPLACSVLLVSLCCRRRAVAGLLALSVLCVCVTGCGSGFRAGTTAANLPGTSHTYAAVVTATTTGVLGAPLTHSTSIGLVITQ